MAKTASHRFRPSSIQPCMAKSASGIHWDVSTWTCESWLARYGANPNAIPAQKPARAEPVSRRASRKPKKPESPKERMSVTL